MSKVVETDAIDTPALIAQLDLYLRDHPVRRGETYSEQHPLVLISAAHQALETLAASLARAEGERDALIADRDRPETVDFMRGVQIEAQHQRARWGTDHDTGKSPFDWFWLIGYLSQKAADAACRGDAEKAKHHTISSAAALANWHLALANGDHRFQPGISPKPQEMVV